MTKPKICLLCQTFSLVHVRNLHPGANLLPGCIFGHVNGVLSQFAPGCKFAPTLEVVQIYLHPGANCAHEHG